MKNTLKYYYGIDASRVYPYKDFYKINNIDGKFYFVRYDRERSDIKTLINICIELKNRNILTNEFVCNRFNNYLTPFNNEIFVLIKENVIERKIDINDILYIQNNTLNISFDKSIIRSNYIELWKNKIDFYETKMTELTNKNKLISNTLDYYIGIGENAIIYLLNNSINVNYNHVVLSHRRINEKSESIDFYNPLNYILDNRARDLADYIKILFFYEEMSIDSIIHLLSYINFNRQEYALLIARLLYPTYYFDLIDRILIYKEDDEILKKVIGKSEKYIMLLKKIFYYINYNLRMNIPVVEWIIKK